MYLKMNRRLWGLAQVIKENKRRKRAVKESYRNLKEKEMETFAALRKWETAQLLAPQGQAERGDIDGAAAELLFYKYLVTHSKYILNISGYI